MFVQQKCQLQLGPYPVGARYQGGLVHILEFFHGECAGEAAQACQHLRAHGLLHMLLHQFHGLVARLNVYA